MNYTYKATVAKHSLHDAGDEGGAVQASLVLGHRHEFVYQRFLLDDVIRTLVVICVFQLVSLPTEQGLPHCTFDEQQHVEQFYLAFAILLSHHE